MSYDRIAFVWGKENEWQLNILRDFKKSSTSSLIILVVEKAIIIVIHESWEFKLNGF